MQSLYNLRENRCLNYVYTILFYLNIFVIFYFLPVWFIVFKGMCPELESRSLGPCADCSSGPAVILLTAFLIRLSARKMWKKQQ